MGERVKYIVLQFIGKYMSWIKYLFGQSFIQEYYTKGVITMLLSLVAGLVLINSYIIIGVLGVIGYFIPISYRIIYTMLKSVSYGDKRIKYDNPNYRYVLDMNGFRRFKWDTWYDKKVDELDTIYF